MKKNIKISAETHKNLNIFCVIQDITLSEGAEEILESWLKQAKEEEKEELKKRIREKVRIRCEHMKRRADD